MQHSNTDEGFLLPLPEDDDALIRRADLPRYLPVASQTLARWAVEGQGPRFIKVGRRAWSPTGLVTSGNGSRARSEKTP